MSSIDDIAFIENKLDEFCASPEPDKFLISIFSHYLRLLKEVGYDEHIIKDKILVPVVNKEFNPKEESKVEYAPSEGPKIEYVNPKEEYTGLKVEYKTLNL